MIVLSFDTDYAPDFVLEDILNIIDMYRFQATFFCTNAFPGNDRSNIEFALHPNFMPDSTQGDSVEDILFNFKKDFPTAIGVRTHRLYWYAGLQEKLIDHGITYDSSIFLPFHSHLAQVRIGKLIRIPYWWSDNIHLLHGMDCNAVRLPGLKEPGLKIFDFHPIHIYLNTKDLDDYREALKTISPLREATPKQLDVFRNSGSGIGTFFEKLCKHIKTSQERTFTVRGLIQ